MDAAFTIAAAPLWTPCRVFCSVLFSSLLFFAMGFQCLQGRVVLIPYGFVLKGRLLRRPWLGSQTAAVVPFPLLILWGKISHDSSQLLQSTPAGILGGKTAAHRSFALWCLTFSNFLKHVCQSLSGSLISGGECSRWADALFALKLVTRVNAIYCEIACEEIKPFRHLQLEAEVLAAEQADWNSAYSSVRLR